MKVNQLTKGVRSNVFKGITKSKFRRGYELRNYILSCIGAFIGLCILGLVTVSFFTPQEIGLLIGSFGSTAILLFAEIKSPLAQPRNLFGGHIIGAFIGVTIFKLIGSEIWIAAPLAVALSIILMKLTDTVHPPGGATSLIAVIGGKNIFDLGYYYVLYPVLPGIIILFFIALLFNNAVKGRKYPERWY